jgi:hypothetical protein
MRIEDYARTAAAQRRAMEYDSPDRYLRLTHLPGAGTAEKDSLRLWAVARGRRIYALTTNSSRFISMSLPRELGRAVAELPRR